MFYCSITANDLAPHAIVVNFKEQVFCTPSVRTCSIILNLSASYSCYNEVSDESINVLTTLQYRSDCRGGLLYNLFGNA